MHEIEPYKGASGTPGADGGGFRLGGGGGRLLILLGAAAPNNPLCTHTIHTYMYTVILWSFYNLYILQLLIKYRIF